MNSEG